MLDDWDTIPLISLKVVDGNEDCPNDHPEEVIYRQSPVISSLCTCKQWVEVDEYGNRGGGSLSGYGVQRKLIYKYYTNESCFNYRNGKDIHSCYWYPPTPAINLSNINGRKICGLRGGKNFREAVRPLREDGRCPEGFKACPLGKQYGASSSLSTFWLN